MLSLVKPSEAKFRQLIAAREARASSVQNRGAASDVDVRTTIGTEDEIVCSRLPRAQSTEGEDIVLALSGSLLPESSFRLPRGSPARRASVAFEYRDRTPTAKTLAGRLTVVKQAFAALEEGTSSASALLGARRCTVVTYDKVEPDMARTLAALSNGPLGGTTTLRPAAEAAHRNVHEVKDGIDSYMASALSLRK